MVYGVPQSIFSFGNKYAVEKIIKRLFQQIIKNHYEKHDCQQHQGLINSQFLQSGETTENKEHKDCAQ
jgi:hypothetical protein